MMRVLCQKYLFHFEKKRFSLDFQLYNLARFAKDLVLITFQCCEFPHYYKKELCF